MSNSNDQTNSKYPVATSVSNHYPETSKGKGELVAISFAKGGDDWWDRLGLKEQTEYLRGKKKSKFHITAKIALPKVKKAATVAADVGQKIKKKATKAIVDSLKASADGGKAFAAAFTKHVKKAAVSVSEKKLIRNVVQNEGLRLAVLFAGAVALAPLAPYGALLALMYINYRVEQPDGPAKAQKESEDDADNLPDTDDGGSVKPKEAPKNETEGETYADKKAEEAKQSTSAEDEEKTAKEQDSTNETADSESEIEAPEGTDHTSELPMTVEEASGALVDDMYNWVTQYDPEELATFLEAKETNIRLKKAAAKEALVQDAVNSVIKPGDKPAPKKEK